MVRPSPPRIEWSPGGTRFVTRLVDDRIRLHAEDGRVLRSLGRALDARWDGDDAIISIDDRGELRWHGPIGVVAQRQLASAPVAAGRVSIHGAIAAAAFAPGAKRCALVTSRECAVLSFAGDAGARDWKLDPKKHHVPSPDHLTAALSHDGGRLALGFTAEDGARGPGRGFVVIDLAGDVVIARDFVALAQLLDAPIGFAFDRAGRRFVTTHPEPFPALGVLDLDRRAVAQHPLDDVRGHTGGARAVALDDRGAIAAYAYAHRPAGIGGRLVFDFLGVEVPDVEGTLAFDPELPDVVALGFDPVSRWLAVLASTGEIEIVPVP